MTYSEALNIKVGDFVTLISHPSCAFKITEIHVCGDSVNFKLEAVDRYMVVRCDYRKVEKYER